MPTEPEQPTDVLNPPDPAGGAMPPLEAGPSEADELRQKWLFAQADLDNYRKRAVKDLEQERLYRSLPLARDLLPGLDNLRRALDAVKSASDVAQLTQGVQMVLQQFETVFATHSIKPIPAVGQPFDPNLHQAIQQVPSAEHAPGTVVAEYQKGYMLHDRVVRPSTVVVAAPNS
jgi:molecular chaperone GrpE